MTSKAQKQDMEAALKTLWGASAWPFAAAVKDACETTAHDETLRRLEQCMAVHSSGVLHGPNGVGKSRLVQSLVERLPQKTYRTLVLSYSSLTGTDVMRYLCHLHGLNLAQRRSDNLMALRTMWGQRDGLWPVWIFEEAQNLTTMGLEELRLLSCERLDTQSPFSLLLVGDATLMPRLHMGVNRPRRLSRARPARTRSDARRIGGRRPMGDDARRLRGLCHGSETPLEELGI
jgi:type II secretory pathway predicted ATPase ExeA